MTVLRVRGGRLVEHRGGRSPPVDHERFVVGVADPDPPDVADFTATVVESTEDQAIALGVEDRESPNGVVDHDVALEQTAIVVFLDLAGVAEPTTGASVTLDLLGPLHHRGQPGVHVVDVALLAVDLGLFRRGGGHHQGIPCVVRTSGNLPSLDGTARGPAVEAAGPGRRRDGDVR